MSKEQASGGRLGEVTRGREAMQSIIDEYYRAVEMWGTEFDDKNTANDWAAYICRYVADGAYSGRQNQYSPERFYENLAKAAGLCLAAMAAIKRNGDCAPRHYEGLPNAGAKTNERE
jgi:hypothetical protein